MRKAVLMLLALVFSTSLALADETKGNVLSLSTKGEAKIQADTAVIEFNISASEEDAVEGQKSFDKKLKLIEKTVAGVDSSLCSFTLKFGKSSVLPKPTVFRGGGCFPQQAPPEPGVRFIGQGSIVITKINELTPVKLRKCIAALFDNLQECKEAAETPYLRFEYSDMEELKQTAYTNAVKKAKTRAANLAKAADKSVGKVISITDITPSNQTPMYRPELRTDLYRNIDIEVEVSLTVEFELKD